MRLVTILLSIFVSVLSSYAQELIYVHTKSGKAIELNIEDIKEINFELGKDKLMGNARSLFYKVETPAYVDLGLSVLWATANIGASSPEEVGNFYAWGETVPQLSNSYSYASYLREYDSPITGFMDCGSDKDPLKSYVDKKGENYDLEKGIAGSQFDVATVTLGSQWRMPTVADFTELYEKCTWNYVKNYNDSGINGYVVSSKSNDNSIFLPCSGTVIDGKEDENSFDYWTSCPTTMMKAGAQDFRMKLSTHEVQWGMNLRYFGTPIRPVMVKPTVD